MKLNLLNDHLEILKVFNVKSKFILKINNNRLVQNSTIRVIKHNPRTFKIVKKLEPVKIITNRQGIKGASGKSAYEIAVANGFNGNQEEWLVTLKATSIEDIGDTNTDFRGYFRSRLNDPSS